MDDQAISIFNTGHIIDGKWVLIERIGKGGMGEVYRAHQLNLNRDVAIKLISEELLKDLDANPEELEGLAGRFQREVQTMAQVRHPNVLQIFDYGSIRVDRDGKVLPVEYISMEYVPGNTLRFTMSEQGLEDEEHMLADWLRRYFIPVLEGVAAIHTHGIVHRDLKPENVLMDGETPKIADFGLARSLKIKAVSNSWDVKGTWPYMAPEQFADFRKTGFEADIYALGKILFEATAGKLDSKILPFKTVGLNAPQTPVMKQVDKVIRKATQEEKSRRYQSVNEFRQAVKQILETAAAAAATGVRIPSTDARPLAFTPWLWVGVIAALLSMAGMTVYHLVDRPRSGHIPGPTVSGSRMQNTAPEPGGPHPTLLALDGRNMVLVENPGAVDSFYADSALVTFHHYTEFLNQVVDTVDSLTISDGMVTFNDDIWLYMGDGSEPSEQIIYEHGRFHLRQTAWAAQPVTRVTWLGAQAYARHYGKRLPTLLEWKALAHQYAEAVGQSQSPSAGAFPGNASDAPHSRMPMMVPSEGSAGKQQHVAFQEVAREWLGTENDMGSSRHIVEWSASGGQTSVIVLRQAWEAFVNTGFRTVMEVPQEFLVNQ